MRCEAEETAKTRSTRSHEQNIQVGWSPSQTQSIHSCITMCYHMSTTPLDVIVIGRRRLREEAAASQGLLQGGEGAALPAHILSSA